MLWDTGPLYAAGFPLGIVDAHVMAISERMNITKIASIDHRSACVTDCTLALPLAESVRAPGAGVSTRLGKIVMVVK